MSPRQIPQEPIEKTMFFHAELLTLEEYFERQGFDIKEGDKYGL